jgi:fatty acid desaturase
LLDVVVATNWALAHEMLAKLIDVAVDLLIHSKKEVMMMAIVTEMMMIVVVVAVVVMMMVIVIVIVIVIVMWILRCGLEIQALE